MDDEQKNITHAQPITTPPQRADIIKVKSDYEMGKRLSPRTTQKIFGGYIENVPFQAAEIKNWDR